ncbi:MAG: methyl-accepting chemotaxis protein [Leptospiraceae bacterium]|nr:methyl-accepting chemotaxis protein [Leptospiraceae bacterium]MCZ8348221.1 methyl-accepting chemotaxis protein [Leptospiraceae bacterium]
MSNFKRGYFESFSLRSKMILGFGILSLFFFMTSVSAIVVSTIAGYSLSFVANEQVAKIAHIEKLATLINETKVNLTTSLLTEDEYLISQNQERIRENIIKFSQVLLSIKEFQIKKDESDLLTKINSNNTKWSELLESFLDLQSRNLNASANILYVRGIEPASIEFLTSINSLLLLEKQITIATTNSVLTQLNYAVIVVSILLLMFFALGYFLSKKVIHSVTKPLNIIVNLVENIRKGDLTFEMKQTTNDEIGEMVRVIEEMRSHLQKSINKIRESVDNLTIISQEFYVEAGNFTSSSIDVSDSSKLTSDAIHDLNDAMVDVEQLIKNISREIQSSNQLIRKVNANNEEVYQAILDFSDHAKKTSEGAETVSINLQSAEEAMSEIRTSSNKIQEVVSIITEISDQTNLLSLNASIEAARAGEHGRGFAVVAQEISKLAEKTLVSVKEVTNQIKESRKNIDHGSRVFMTAKEYYAQVYTDVSSIRDTSTNLSNVVKAQKTAFESIQNNLEIIQGHSERIDDSMKNQKETSGIVYSQVNQLSSNSQGIKLGGNLLTINSEKLTEISKEITEAFSRYKTNT